jgi:hypothetical protein
VHDAGDVLSGERDERRAAHRAFGGGLLLIRRPLAEAFARIDDTDIETIIGPVGQWFSDETQSTLRKLSARLGKTSS